MLQQEEEEEEEEATSPRVFLSGLWRITLGDNGFFLGPVFFSELLISTYSVNNFIPQSVPSESHDVLLLSYIYELIQISKLIHYFILGSNKILEFAVLILLQEVGEIMRLYRRSSSSLMQWLSQGTIISAPGNKN